MMRRLFLLAALVLAQPALADAVLPRLGPMPVLAEDGSVSGVADIPFGTRLTILSRDGAVLTVQDESGAPLRLRTTDVIAAPKAGLTLMAADRSGGTTTDRPDLQLWDSAFQLRVFLGGAGSGKLVSSMMIPAESDLAQARLPVLSIDTAETSVGTSVTMVQALFPLLVKALDPAGTGQGDKVILHVLVDGSDYAKPFMLETLRQLSRTLAEQPKLLAEEMLFTRQVLNDSGDIRDDGAVSASGLRSEWPAAEMANQKADMTATLAAALERLVEGIEPSDPATHLVLILAGPGLSDQAGSLKSASAAGARLAARRADGGGIGAILLAQGTPEPNPANGVVLAALAGDAQTRLADFGTNLASELAALTQAKTQDPTDRRVNTICTDAARGELPCLIPTNSTLPPETSSALAGQTPTTWIALPLWLVSESAPLDLVPVGAVGADVHQNQTDIRACAAIGYVWDQANKACGPAGEAQGIDLSDQLYAAQEAFDMAQQERDAARDALARQDADWQDQKADLYSQLFSAETDRDAARTALEDLEDTVARQMAALAEAQDTAAAQADQLTRLTEQDLILQDDLLAAQNQEAYLSADLDQRTAELQTATTEIAALGQQEDQLRSALIAAQTDLATLEATAVTLTRSLADEAAIRAAGAAKAAQAEAELQDRLTSTEAHSAELDDTIAALSQTLDDERAAKATIEASAAQAYTDLQDFRTASAANFTALQAQIAQAQAMVTDLQVAKDDVTARLSNAEAARAEAEQSVQVKDSQIAELGWQIETLTGSVSDSAQQLADLGATLDQERRKSQTLQAEAAAELARLDGEIADLTRTGDVNATLLAQSVAAKADLAALQEKNDALATANTAATSQLTALSGTVKQADARLAELHQDLTATRLTLETIQAERAALQAENDAFAKAGATATSQMKALSEAAVGTESMLADLRQNLAAAGLKLETAQTRSAAQIAALQGQVADLTKSRDDLADQVAQLSVEKNDQLATLQAERDAPALQVSSREQQVTASPDAEIPAVTAQLAATAEPPLFADAVTLRPKPRPADLTGANEAASAPQQKKALAMAVPLPPTNAKPTTMRREVAPSLKAPRLNGCTFQWTGQVGKLLCP